MSMHSNISYDRFPGQGKALGKKVSVCFDYEVDRQLVAICIRDDMEDPFITLFQLEDGRVVQATECQYRLSLE